MVGVVRVGVGVIVRDPKGNKVRGDVIGVSNLGAPLTHFCTSNITAFVLMMQGFRRTSQGLPRRRDTGSARRTP